MAIVKPFKGVTFNLEKVLLKQVIAPCEDVFNEQLSEKYTSNYNISNLFIKDKDGNFDNSLNLYNQWKKEEILIKEQEHVFYLYEQEFEFEDKLHTRTGFVGLNKIDLNYEDVLIDEKFESDNYNFELVKSIKSNINQVVGLYKDEEDFLEILFSKIKKTMPVLSAVDENEVKNTVWLIKDEEDIDYLENQMKDKKVLIADGFETYKNAVKYCKYMREKNNNSDNDIKPYDFVMTTFFNILDSGIKVYNLSRVLKYADSFDVEDFLDKLGKYFKLKKLDENAEVDNEIYPIKMYLADDEYGLVIEDEYLEKLHPTKRKLISYVLHKIVINEILNINQNNFSFNLTQMENVNFQNKNQIVFCITEDAKKSVLDIFEQSASIFTTSVYTYPKLQSGLIINEL